MRRLLKLRTLLRMCLRLFVFSALLTSSLLACGGDHSHDDHDHTDSTGATCDSTLTYAADIKPIADKYCASCHSSALKNLNARMFAPLGHDYDSKAGLLATRSHVAERAAGGPDGVNRTMPPAASAQPSDDERKTLGAWLACDSPN